MTICKGCGATLQYTDPKGIGYSPKEGAEYCQRCFRLTHYDDLTVSFRKGIDADTVMERIENTEGLILWVVDLFDIESAWIKGMAKRLAERDILFVGTKRDLLPETVNHEKLARFLFSRLKDNGISVKQMIFTGKGYEGEEEVLRKAHELSKGKPILVIGRANAGKSTLLNRLMNNTALTTSRYPGTTLEFNEVSVGEDTYIDTPGMEDPNSMTAFVEEKNLSFITPRATVKPVVFQIYEDQTYFLGGLARLDVVCKGKATVTWYLPQELYLHRTNTKNADELFQKQYGKLLVPTPLEEDFVTHEMRKQDIKTDVVIHGLGWACISGNVTVLKISVPKRVNITFRKAMI